MPKKRRKKRWIIIPILLLIVIIVANAARGRDTSGPVIEPLTVARGDIVRRLAESGTVEMDRLIEIKSQVAGRIITLHSDVGQVTAEGALLAVIEPDPNKALQLSGKRASVTRAEMDLAEQQRQLETKRQNYADGIIARDEIERAEYSFTLAEIGLDQQRLELQILEREVRDQARAVQATADSFLLEDYEIYSPLQGIVTERPVEEGELVTSAVSSNQGTILFRVGDPDQLIVTIQISEIDIGDMRSGLESDVRVDALPGQTFPGRLRHVAPTGAVRSGSAVVSFEAEVEILGVFPQLRHGMSADVDIIIDRRFDVLFLPVEGIASVYREDEGGGLTNEIERRIVYVRNGETWEEREVETGLESNTRIEILSGLEEGDEVHPDAQIEWERRSGHAPTDSPSGRVMRNRIT
jgi:HlyD family secretion protein